MIRGAVVLLLLFVSLSLAADSVVAEVVVSRAPKRQFAVRILLHKPSSVKIYYDTEKPAARDNLRAYWFSHVVRGIRKEHRFVLPEVGGAQTFYFRIERKTGTELVSGLFFWNGKKTVPVP